MSCWLKIKKKKILPYAQGLLCIVEDVESPHLHNEDYL